MTREDLLLLLIAELLAAAKFAVAESDDDPDAPMSWAAHTNLTAAIARAEQA